MLVPLYFDLPTLDLDCCARKNSNMASKILSVICMPCIGLFPWELVVPVNIMGCCSNDEVISQLTFS